MRMLLLLGVVTWHVTISNAKSYLPGGKLTPEEVAVARIHNTFSTKLFKSVFDDVPDNLILSPIVVSTILMMLLYGAGGSTKDQLCSALELPSNFDSLQPGISSIIDKINKVDEANLLIENAIFVADNFEPKTKFINVMRNAFRSEVQNVNFSDPVSASQTINEWCEDLISADDLNSETYFVLASAISFSGDWQTPFDAKITMKSKFRINDSIYVYVDTMSCSDQFRTGMLDEFKARFIEIPYKMTKDKTPMVLYVILPNEGSSVDALVKNLKEVDVKIFNKGSYSWYELRLPKFEVRSDIDLENPLKKLNITDIFNAPDFTGIVDNYRFAGVKAAQKAFINVHEWGTGAAAAPPFGFGPRVSYPQYVVDRPFVSMIVYNYQVTLFMAAIKDPGL